MNDAQADTRARLLLDKLFRKRDPKVTTIYEHRMKKSMEAPPAGAKEMREALEALWEQRRER